MIEPSTALTPIASRLALKFGQSVITRWTTYRRERFYESFLSLFRGDVQDEREVEAKLERILSDEILSGLLYDSYLKVCLSKSRDVGPRIIGLLTAALIVRGEIADEEEECLFAAAERLSDDEFYSFYRHYQKLIAEIEDSSVKKKRVLKSGDGVIEILDENWIEVGIRRNTDSEITPPTLWQSMGSWAAKLGECGLMNISMTLQVHHIEEDSERHIDYDQTWNEYITKVYYESPCKRLSDLFVQSLPQKTELGE